MRIFTAINEWYTGKSKFRRTLKMDYIVFLKSMIDSGLCDHQKAVLAGGWLSTYSEDLLELFMIERTAFIAEYPLLRNSEAGMKFIQELIINKIQISFMVIEGEIKIENFKDLKRVNRVLLTESIHRHGFTREINEVKFAS